MEHLRQLLVSGGALPARDEQLSRLERTLGALLEQAHPEDAAVLRRYAAFHVLPRVRSRLDRGANTVGVCDAATNALRRDEPVLQERLGQAGAWSCPRISIGA